MSETYRKHQWPGLTLFFETNGSSDASLALQQDFGLGREPIDQAVRTHLRLSAHGLRCDWTMPGSNAASHSLAQLGSAAPQLIDHVRKLYWPLPLSEASLAAGSWRIERTGVRRKFDAGLAEEHSVQLTPRNEWSSPVLRLWLLEEPPESFKLDAWWQVLLPGLTLDQGPLGLPVEIQLWRDNYTGPEASMRLITFDQAKFPISTFLPPKNYQPAADGKLYSHELPQRKQYSPKPPVLSGSAPMPPFLSMILSTGCDEAAKVLVSHRVLEQIRGLINKAANRLTSFRGMLPRRCWMS